MRQEIVFMAEQTGDFTPIAKDIYNPNNIAVTTKRLSKGHYIFKVSSNLNNLDIHSFGSTDLEFNAIKTLNAKYITLSKKESVLECQVKNIKGEYSDDLLKLLKVELVLMASPKHI